MKDLFQILFWAVAIVTGLVTAFRAIAEAKKSFRWKQAEMAKTILDEIWGNPSAYAALKMLDWSGLSFKQPDETMTPEITHEERRASLRVIDTVFRPGDPGPFIRDAYDALFDGFERLEHFIRIKLIRFEDVEPRLRYHVSKLAQADERPVAEVFLDSYDFQLAARFLERFPSWNAQAPLQTAGDDRRQLEQR